MPAVDRVLPWRRSGGPAVNDELAEVVTAYRRRHPRASTTLICKAYEVAADAHEGQVRMSGAPYICHPVAVAAIPEPRPR